MKRLSSIFLLFLCFQLKAADRREITHIVGEKAPLLRKINQKSKFSMAELNASLSYHIIKQFPPEIGIRIVGKLFEFDDEKIKKITEMKMPRSVLLKSFYEWQGYQLLKSSRLSEYIRQGSINFQDLSGVNPAQIFDVLEALQNDPDQNGCCCKSPNVFSQKTYDIVEKFIQTSNADIVGKKSLCCCGDDTPRIVAAAGLFPTVQGFLLAVFSCAYGNPIPAYVLAGEVATGLMGWGCYMYRAGCGFVQISKITKNK